MNKLWFWATCMPAASVMMSGGCSQAMSDAFFAETPRESKQLHQLTRDQLVAHDRNMTEQHKTMDPESAAAIDELEADFKTRVAEIEEKAREVHSEVGEIVRTLINRFAGMADGEPIPSLLASVVGKETDKVRADVVAGLRGVSVDIEHEAQTRSTEIAAMEAEILAATEARLAQIAEETRLKLANVEAKRLVELEKLKGDDKAFREKLQQEARLTDAEMDALKGFSTEELMALLLAAGGAAAAGGALSKTGRSRAQPQIDTINARLGNPVNKTG